MRVSRTAGTTMLLTSPGFVLAVTLLVLNDWLLKPVVGNWWTGKLSDFAGLFAFAVFWSALLPRHRRAVCTLTAAGFLVWKSPLSDPALAAWNALGIWPLARIIDYSDWLALAALFPAYRLSRARGAGLCTRRPHLARRIGALAAGGGALAAFTATSVRRPNPLPNPPEYAVAGSPSLVRAALDSLGFRPEGRRSKTPRAADTLTLYVRQPPERWVAVRAEVREGRPGQSSIRLLEILPWSQGPLPTTESIDRAFRAQVVAPLREWLAQRRTPGESFRIGWLRGPVDTSFREGACDRCC